ncbi:MAG: type I-D CRISPR-associated helicase Cas3' [Candidatus Wallbacteria bacterium]|nr:type I-D CRISPR-associated helicase Cas3' [Candidatus Wallbacteria bacterium]
MLKIEGRSVKYDQERRRIFQAQALKAVESSPSKFILVEAPVGAGKSYIFRKVLTAWNGPVVLTYPTKLLMNQQLRDLRTDYPGAAVWPDEIRSPEGDAPTIFHYSTDSMVRYLKHADVDQRLNRSELLDEVFNKFRNASRRNIFLTTPDVLHLLYNVKAYRGAARLASFLNGGLVVFDEFHLYTALSHFPRLLERLFESGIGKVVLLSATPVVHEELDNLFQKYGCEKIGFADSIGTESDTVFNYPLDLEFANCRYTNLNQVLSILDQYITILPKPLAFIMDSVFRLRHLIPVIRNRFPQFQILEYSGFEKDRYALDDKTILVGTSSIEVGINMDFKSLITEAAYWTSAIQRIGRVGRFSPGTVIVLTNKNLDPYISGKTVMTRDELENTLLKEVLKDIRMTHVCGEMFRGDSYPFLIHDLTLKRLSSYTESVFSMFEPENCINDWRKLSFDRKKELLKRYSSDSDLIEDLLIRDKLVPFWGLIAGRLRDEYERVITRQDDNELEVTCDPSNKRYYFEGRSDD